jgi:two-component system, chemotaxis family, chemotaxis protein CheY
MRRLTTDLVHFGQPLPLDVFNRDGHLLAKAGYTLDDEFKYRELLDFGYIEGDEPAPRVPVREPWQLLPELGVLIADDMPLMLDMLEKSLRGLGVERILRAEDGEIALARVGRFSPDLVFLDIDMPRRDGLSALRTLREEFPTLFVCMLSAHSSVDNVRAALAAGASAFLVKPFHRDKLEGLLLQFAKKRLAGAA